MKINSIQTILQLPEGNSNYFIMGFVSTFGTDYLTAELPYDTFNFGFILLLFSNLMHCSIQPNKKYIFIISFLFIYFLFLFLFLFFCLFDSCINFMNIALPISNHKFSDKSLLTVSSVSHDRSIECLRLSLSIKNELINQFGEKK